MPHLQWCDRAVLHLVQHEVLERALGAALAVPALFSPQTRGMFISPIIKICEQRGVAVMRAGKAFLLSYWGPKQMRQDHLADDGKVIDHHVAEGEIRHCVFTTICSYFQFTQIGYVIIAKNHYVL